MLELLMMEMRSLGRRVMMMMVMMRVRVMISKVAMRYSVDWEGVMMGMLVSMLNSMY